MSGREDNRRRIAAALPCNMADLTSLQIADALMSVVDEIVAEALEDARWAVHVERFNGDEDPEARWPRGTDRRPDSFYAGAVRAEAILRDRAAELRQSISGPQGVQEPLTATAEGDDSRHAQTGGSVTDERPDA